MTYCQLDPREQIPLTFFIESRLIVEENAVQNVVHKMSIE